MLSFSQVIILFLQAWIFLGVLMMLTLMGVKNEQRNFVEYIFFLLVGEAAFWLGRFGFDLTFHLSLLILCNLAGIFLSRYVDLGQNPTELEQSVQEITTRIAVQTKE